MAKKKPLKRKNHATNKNYMPRVRKEFVDMDYMKDLSDKDKAWMEKFAGEYYGGSLNTEQPRKNIHKSRKGIKDCFDRNNRQNNDVYGVTNANGLLNKDLFQAEDRNSGESNDSMRPVQYTHPAQYSNPGITEDSLIEYIDNKELLEYDTKELNVLYQVLDDTQLFKGQSYPKNKRRKRTRNLKKKNNV